MRITLTTIQLYTNTYTVHVHVSRKAQTLKLSITSKPPKNSGHNPYPTQIHGTQTDLCSIY